MNQALISTGCFGKLPPAADYIHHHRGGPGVLEWQRWIQDGVGLASSRLGAAVEQPLRELRIFQFAWPIAGHDACLIGALGPGEDRSGRLFPFSVFAEVALPPAVSMTDPTLGHQTLRQQAADLVVGRDLDLPALFAAVDRLGTDDGPPLPSVSTEDFLSLEVVGTLTQGDGGEALREGLVESTRNLRSVAAQIDRDRRLPAYGLRFPLPADPGRASVALAVFMEMSARTFGVRSRPALFWTTAGSAGFLDIHPGHAGPAAFLHLLDPALEGDAIFVMDVPAAPAKSRNSEGDVAVQCWSDPNLSLKDALELGLPSSRTRRL